MSHSSKYFYACFVDDRKKMKCVLLSNFFHQLRKNFLTALFISFIKYDLNVSIKKFGFSRIPSTYPIDLISLIFTVKNFNLDLKKKKIVLLL